MGTRFSARPDRPWGPPSLLYNGYRVFPGSKVRSGRAADHSPPSSATVMEEYSYTSTHHLGHTEPVTGSSYLPLPKTDFSSCLNWTVNFPCMLARDNLHKTHSCCVRCGVTPVKAIYVGFYENDKACKIRHPQHFITTMP